MTKKLAKILIMGVLIIMCIGLFAGCGDDIATDRVFVTIKAEYKEKFLAEEFSVEDFEWENVERIEYRTWYSDTEPESGRLVVFFKKHSKKRVQDAKKHFEELAFISSVSFDGKQTIQ